MFETITNKLINLISFGELRLPSFLLNVSPSLIAPIKLVKCQTTNENFDLGQHQQQQYYDKSHSTQQLIILPLMIKILHQFIKMIDLKTNPNMTIMSNYSKLICSIEHINDKRYFMSPGTHTVSATKNASSPTGGSPMGYCFDIDYIIYYLETDKINQILKNLSKNITDPIIDQSFILKSDLDLRNFISFTNNHKEEMDVSHNDNETKMSTPPVLVHNDNHHNDHTRDNKRQSPKRHHTNKPLVKLSTTVDSCSISIVPEIRREVPTERKRRKRRKKNHHRGGSGSQVSNSNNNNNNNSTVDKMSLETTNKKKRRKYKKRQRNYDRDIKSEWLIDENKSGDLVQNSVQTTTLCEKLFGNRNEQTKICVSFKKLPPSMPLPSPFSFQHQQPQQATRQRQISECSNDSLEICFLDDCDIDGMVVNYDDDEETDAGDYILNTYRMQHRLCGNSEDSDETDSDSGFREEKKVRFDLKPKIHVMRTWDFAHRQARIGEWETIARDRVRFTDRIKKLDTIITPVLSKEHRDKIFLNRFM